MFSKGPNFTHSIYSAKLESVYMFSLTGKILKTIWNQCLHPNLEFQLKAQYLKKITQL